MKTRLFVTTILFVCIGFIPHAKSQMSHEQKEQMQKLQCYLGNWEYEGEEFAGQQGPGGKVVGKVRYAWILGKYFLRGYWSESGPTGKWEGLEVDGYDPTSKTFIYDIYRDYGATLSGVTAISGDTITSKGKVILKGKQYLERITDIFMPDLTNYTETGEISVDGKTWAALWRAKFVKVGPAAKK